MTDDDETETARREALSPLLTSSDFRPPSSSVRVEFGTLSRRGLSRSVNDDHYLLVRLGRFQETLATSLSAADVPPRFEEHGYAMLVADGLGDGGAGSVASRVALSTIAHMALHYGRWNLRVDQRTVAEVVERAEFFYAHADAAVFAKSRTNPLMAGMSTALTLAYSAGHDLFVAHVGHSRAYRFRDGALTLLTSDQTVEQLLAGSRRPAPVGARAQDLGRILTDAVGARGGGPSVEIEQFQIVDGDCVLLCTNGLTDAVDDDGIANVLALRRRPEEQCEILADLAARRGGEDNLTIVLAQYQVPQ